MEPDWWLEVENTYKERIAQRKALYEEHGESVLQWLPGSELASKELMEMALQFLCARYPQYFKLYVVAVSLGEGRFVVAADRAAVGTGGRAVD